MSAHGDRSAGSGAIRVGVSACLLGDPVRHDGGHKRDGWLIEALGKFVEWVPICPEVEVGMGTPREAVHLVQEHDDVCLVGVRSHTDHTSAMRTYASHRLDRLASEELRGYIFKRDSPSCGLARVRVHHGPGHVTRSGRGLFAAALADRFPTLPLEEEGRLRDSALRESWITRLFAFDRLQRMWGESWSVDSLVGFHTSHKLLLLAHAPQAYQALGRLVADAGRLASEQVRVEYERRFMSALATPATRGRHANVLQHIMGYFRDRLDAFSRHDLLHAIDDYRRGLSPHAVPLALVTHYVHRFHIRYIAGQVYLVPYPKELSLSQP